MADEVAALRRQVQALTELMSAALSVMVADRTLRLGSMAFLADAFRREAGEAAGGEGAAVAATAAELATTVLRMAGDAPMPSPVMLVHDRDAAEPVFGGPAAERR